MRNLISLPLFLAGAKAEEIQSIETEASYAALSHVWNRDGGKIKAGSFNGMGTAQQSVSRTNCRAEASRLLV